MKITDFTSTKLAEFDEKYVDTISREVGRPIFNNRELAPDVKVDYSRAITEAYLLGTIEAYDVLPSRKFEPFTPEEERMHLAISEKLAAIRKEIDGTV